MIWEIGARMDLQKAVERQERQETGGEGERRDRDARQKRQHALIEPQCAAPIPAATRIVMAFFADEV